MSTPLRCNGHKTTPKSHIGQSRPSLHRRKLENGRYERTTPHHSWNSNFLLTNLFLFHLQRHSDHHAYAKRRYQVLRHHESSPQLPNGYAGMIVLALFPPLWRAVMDPNFWQFRH